MSTGALDPQIHDPERLRVVATLAALPGGDTLALARLQDMIKLSPGSLITCLRELGRAGYMQTGKTGGNRAQTTVALTCQGRPRSITTPPCCGSRPRRAGRIIRYQHPACALAMLTGTRLPRPWVSTSRKAG